VNLREHFIAISIHGGILLAICVLILATSCEKQPEPPPPDPVGDFFGEVQDGLDDAGVETITLITVDDHSGEGADLTRQIVQEIKSQLNQLEGISIIEYPGADLEEAFEEYEIVPEDGLSPEDAMDLALELNTGALMYAAIESEAPDVYFQVYTGETGAIVFADTLEDWPLPVERSQQDDLSGILDESGNEEPEADDPEEAPDDTGESGTTGD